MHLCACVRVCVYICMCAHVYIYIHINICTFMHNKLFTLMIFILRTQHIYRSELPYVYMRALLFLQTFTEDIFSDHRSCPGCSSHTVRANQSMCLLQGTILHLPWKQLWGDRCLDTQCPSMLENDLEAHWVRFLQGWVTLTRCKPELPCRQQGIAEDSHQLLLKDSLAKHQHECKAGTAKGWSDWL